MLARPVSSFLPHVCHDRGQGERRAANDDSPLFAGLLFYSCLILTVFAVWMLLRLCLAFPASVVEQAPAWSALKRGVMLSQGTRARIFLLYVLGVFLSQILVWCVTFPILVAVALIPGLQGQAHAQTVGMVVSFMTYSAYFVVKAMTKPIYGIALTVFYFDQRIRKEGFDIEWMMQQAGMLALPAAPGSTSEASSQLLRRKCRSSLILLQLRQRHPQALRPIPTHQAVLETKARREQRMSVAPPYPPSSRRPSIVPLGRQNHPPFLLSSAHTP